MEHGLEIQGDWDVGGWTVARGVLDRETVAQLRRHLDHLLAADPAAAATGLLAGTVVDDPVWLAAVADPRLLDLVELLLGCGIALFSSCWVGKPPGSTRVASWHQDGGTWPLDPLVAATLWVALDDADAGNGGLRVVPGSHRRGLLPHHRDDARLATDLFNVCLPPGTVDDADAVDVVLRAGDVSAHHPALIHGSGPNRSDRPRRALVARYRPLTTRVTQEAWPSSKVLRPAPGSGTAASGPGRMPGRRPHRRPEGPQYL